MNQTVTPASAEPTATRAAAPSAPGTRARRSRAVPAVLTLTAIALIAGAGVVWWQRTHSAPTSSPLEPAPATASILVPAEELSASAPSAGPVAIPAEAPADPASDALNALRTAIDELKSRIDALETSDGTRGEQLATLRADLDKVTAAQRAMPEAAPARRVRRAMTSNVPPPQRPDASILAVDLWGGTPSVVVGKAGAGGTEVRFLNQGETQGRVTLQRADVGGQRATFSTPTGEFTLGTGER